MAGWGISNYSKLILQKLGSGGVWLSDYDWKLLYHLKLRILFIRLSLQLLAYKWILRYLSIRECEIVMSA